MIHRTGAREASQLFDELLVDNFAGGGGASTGIERALGRAVDVAINHDPEAVAVHRANHPATKHLCQDVFDVDPVAVTGGRPVGVAWFSPDCTYFSKARGAKPIRDVKRRDLAWVVIRWARAVRPRVILLENVEEFRGWGPLVDGRPCPERRGETFEKWLGELRGEGYEVEWRELRASDHGAPTVRKRLFLIARCDGQPIVWPEATHGPGRELPHRTAAECIDWSLECPSIFERARPLAENTLRRIAAGVRRLVRGGKGPFVVNNMTNNAARSCDEPLATILTGGHKILAQPFAVHLTHHGERRSLDLADPAPTITGAHRGELALVQPFGVGLRGTSDAHIDAAARDLAQPARTLTAAGTHEALVAAFAVPRYGERPTQDPRCISLARPLPTIVGTGNGATLVAGFLAKHFGGVVGQRADIPASTVTSKDHHALVTAALDGRRDHGRAIADLVERLTPGPLERDSEGRLVAHVDGAPFALLDLGMRMLAPRELFLCQGFPPNYVIEHGLDERGAVVAMTKTTQVRLCGNSVCPPIAEALVRANCADMVAEGWRAGHVEAAS